MIFALFLFILSSCIKIIVLLTLIHLLGNFILSTSWKYFPSSISYVNKLAEMPLPTVKSRSKFRITLSRTYWLWYFPSWCFPWLIFPHLSTQLNGNLFKILVFFRKYSSSLHQMNKTSHLSQSFFNIYIVVLILLTKLGYGF